MYISSNVILLKSVLLYFSLCSATTLAQWLVDDEGCRTPDKGVGDCILARRCKPLVDFIRRVPKPISNKIKIELNKYTCGYDGGIKVCCPQGPISLKISEEITDNSDGLLKNPPPPPDVTNHRNFKLLPEECGYLGNPDKIRNGVNAKLNEFPWMALLSYNTNKGAQFQCGGTILNNKYILTAAHCISDLIFPLLGVRIGEHSITSKVDCEFLDDGNEVCSKHPVQDLAIEQIIIHPGFNKTVIVDDIGLIRVTKMNLDAENARPVCLPITEETRNAKFNFCTVTGWGFTEAYGNNADVLQKVDLPVMNLTKCRDSYKAESRVKISYKQICAGGRNKKDSCPGDSGGPMQIASYLNDEIRYVQQGIVSFGHRFCGMEGYPGVYTRIAYYMDWILDNIKP